MTTRLEELQAELATAQKAASVPTKMENLETELAASQKANKEAEPWYEDFGEGVGVSGLETYYGIKDLAGQMDDEDRATLKDWQEDAAESGWGTAGQVVGELGQFVLPGGVALKGVKAASKLKRLSALKGAGGALGAETGVAAGMGALRLPDEDKTRLEGAKSDATGAVVGGALGRVLSKTLRGADKSQIGKKLLGEGVPLTPGQQAEGKAVQGLEQILDYFPIASRAGTEGRERALKKWNENVLNKAAPEGTEITKIGPAGGKQLAEATKKGYDKAWRGAGRLSAKDGQVLLNNLEASRKRLGIADNRVIENMMQDIEAMVIKRNPKTAQDMDDILRRAIDSAGRKKHELRTALEKTRKSLRNRMPTKNKEELAAMDAKYPAYLTARNAIGRSAKKDGTFTPDDLTDAVKSKGKGKAEIGEAALQDVSDEGRHSVGRLMSEPLPGAWRRFVRNAPPWGMETLGKTFMGNTGIQKAGASVLRNSKGAAIRELASPARLGATYPGDD